MESEERGPVKYGTANLAQCSFATDERIKVFEFGSGGGTNYAVFENAERLLREFRLLCHSIYRPKDETNEWPALPVILMPVQVQVLLENGFAQVMRIKEPAGGRSDSLTSIDDVDIKQNEGASKPEDEQHRLRELARQVVLGRKIKARKRAMMLDGAAKVSSEALKVRKLDRQMYATELLGDDDTAASCSPEELNEAMDELRRRKDEKRNSKTDARLEGQLLSYVSPVSTSFERVWEPNFPQSAEYGVRLTVFRDLWRKGFYLANGAKFGCDFLAYEKPPTDQHSTFMVMCTDVRSALRPLSLIGVSRASTQVKKRILLAIVSAGSLVPYYLEMNWWKGDGDR